MTAQHTQGRLVHRGHGVLVGGPMIELTNGLAQGQVAMVCVMDDVDHIENARRLAVCWNFCEGLATENIENANAAHAVSTALAAGDSINAELAAARALLAKLVTLHENADVCEITHGCTTSEFRALIERAAAFLKGQP